RACALEQRVESGTHNWKHLPFGACDASLGTGVVGGHHSNCVRRRVGHDRLLAVLPGVWGSNLLRGNMRNPKSHSAGRAVVAAWIFAYAPLIDGNPTTLVELQGVGHDQ